MDTACPWITREHVYEHAHVSLHFSGHGLAWRDPRPGAFRSPGSRPTRWTSAPCPPANGHPEGPAPASRLGITHAGEIGVDAQLASSTRPSPAGLRLVQIPRGSLPAMSAKASPARSWALPPPRRLAVVNGDAALARRSAPTACPAAHGRGASPVSNGSARSATTAAELGKAAALGLDYALSAPSHDLTTRNSRPGLGRFKRDREGPAPPVFALGGLAPATHWCRPRPAPARQSPASGSEAGRTGFLQAIWADG